MPTDTLIVEGLVTTLDATGRVNFAPMGPIVDASMTRLTLRPFRTSSTYVNLRERGEGVFHVIDDVELLARAAVDRLELDPPTRAAETVRGAVLQDMCGAFEFRVTRVDDDEQRTRIDCAVVARVRGRDFLGFNRASHAVLELAILATRLHLVHGDVVRQEIERWSVVVDKTAGPVQRRAFEFLRQYIAEQLR